METDATAAATVSNTANDNENNDEITREGAYVIVILPDESKIIVKLGIGKEIKIRKRTCLLDDIIGEKYGTKFILNEDNDSTASGLQRNADKVKEMEEADKAREVSGKKRKDKLKKIKFCRLVKVPKSAYAATAIDDFDEDKISSEVVVKHDNGQLFSFSEDLASLVASRKEALMTELAFLEGKPVAAIETALKATIGANSSSGDNNNSNNDNNGDDADDNNDDSGSNDDGDENDDEDGENANKQSESTFAEKQEMKKRKKSGRQFEEMTTMAQEKFLRRKQKKHGAMIQIIKCTSATIAEALCPDVNSTDMSKLGPIRWGDSMAQILMLSNVHAGCKVLVMESYSGFVTGSLCERMGGYGNLYAVHSSKGAHLAYVDYFNFKPEQKRTIVPISLDQLLALQQGEVLSTIASSSNTVSVIANDNGDEKKDASAASSSSIANAETATIETSAVEGGDTATGPNNQFRRPRDYSPLLSGVDCLVIAVEYDASHLLPKLFPFLLPSKSLVIFSKHIEPLVKCKRILEKEMRGEAIDIRIHESWFREYQILPMKSHPNMSMHGEGGYFLRAIKVTQSN